VRMMSPYADHALRRMMLLGEPLSPKEMSSRNSF